MSPWSNPRLLNLVSNAVFAFTALLVMAGAGYQLVRSPAFPLRAIEVGGRLDHVRRTHVIAALQGQVSGTFFTADLDRLRDRFETIAWVRRAEVRRRWPDRLVVQLEEHVALARWGRPEDQSLVNTRGEAFKAFSTDALPLFVGPAGSERLVAGRYAEFHKLMVPLGVTLSQVLLSERLAWQLRLANGVLLQLGRDAPGSSINERLGRFVEAYPRALGKYEGRIEPASLRVDLRYPNGFAVRIPGIERMNSVGDARPRA